MSGNSRKVLKATGKSGGKNGPAPESPAAPLGPGVSANSTKIFLEFDDGVLLETDLLTTPHPPRYDFAPNYPITDGILFSCGGINMGKLTEAWAKKLDTEKRKSGGFSNVDDEPYAKLSSSMQKHRQSKERLNRQEKNRQVRKDLEISSDSEDEEGSMGASKVTSTGSITGGTKVDVVKLGNQLASLSIKMESAKMLALAVREIRSSITTKDVDVCKVPQKPEQTHCKVSSTPGEDLVHEKSPTLEKAISGSQVNLAAKETGMDSQDSPLDEGQEFAEGTADDLMPPL